jgi:succinate dehydrogenase/fumarate reductase-like Fe-S protein
VWIERQGSLSSVWRTAPQSASRPSSLARRWTLDRRGMGRDQNGLGLCNITKCCTEVCPATGSIPESTRLRRDVKEQRSVGAAQPRYVY